MIVLNFVLRHPNKVNKLVLINTFAGFPNQQGITMYKNGLIDLYHKKLKDPAESFFISAKNGFTRNFWKQMKEDPKKKFYGLWSADDLIQHSITDIQTPQDIENAANAIAGHNVIERLDEIKSETLVLCANKDKISPVLANEKIHASIPNSVFKIIKDAGHDSKLEKAPEVNKVILEFLED